MKTNPILSFISIFVSCASATYVAYPLQSQFPLIARVGESYSWSISPYTFKTSSNIVATQIPEWLTFDNGTFSGTPSEDDEGMPSIVLEAGGVSDEFILCVTPYPPPIISIPLSKQFNNSNPSFSSVFFLHPNSALPADVPTIRVPPNWTFSVGFEGGTFAPGGRGGGDVFYSALLSDGSPLPSWLDFDPATYTLNGYTRSPPAYDPDTVSVMLIGADQEGFSAVNSTFDIIVASHELSYTGSQPILPINATIGEMFNFTFSDSDWVFEGVMFDNSSIQSGDWSAFSLDTSRYSWLDYDASSYSLSGLPPSSTSNETITVPATLVASNQSLSLNVSVAVLPSYFTKTTLEPQFLPLGSDLFLSLQSYISKDNIFSGHNVDLNATYNPSMAGSFLDLGQSACNGNSGWCLSGNIPSNSTFSHINVTMAAYDHTTHASSHLSFLLEVNGGGDSVPDSIAVQIRKRKIALGVGIALGVLAGCFALFGCLAVCRKYCSVKDTAMDALANEKAIAMESAGNADGYGWMEKFGLNANVDPDAKEISMEDIIPVVSRPYDGVGIGSAPHDPRRVTKAAFFEGVKTTIRKISAGGRRSMSLRKKAMIGRPILLLNKDSAGPMQGSPKNILAYRGSLFNGIGPNSNVALAGSVQSDNTTQEYAISGLSCSPASSAGHPGSQLSVPRQRPDFGPPRAMLGKSPLIQQTNADQQTDMKARRQSAASQKSYSSGENEHEEAVIATASRAPSVHSARSTYSYVGSPKGPRDHVAKPRLVQFTSARGVPVPVPSIPAAVLASGQTGHGRRVSHVAQVCGVDPQSLTVPGEPTPDPTLSEGMRYVRAFGDQDADIAPKSSPRSGSRSRRQSAQSTSQARPVSMCTTGTATTSNNHGSPSLGTQPTQSSYIYPSPSASFDSMPGSAHQPVPTILVGAGQAFSFKLPVVIPNTQAPPSGITKFRSSSKKLSVKMISGPGGTRNGGEGKLPKWMSYAYMKSHGASEEAAKTKSKGKTGSLKEGKMREEMELWGVPGVDDVGEVIVGVFDDKGNQVGALVIDVVSLRKS